MPAYYANSLARFVNERSNEIFAALVTRVNQDGFASLYTTATEVWERDIAWLQDVLRAVRTAAPDVCDWGVLLEFPIPRRQKRVDAVLLAGDLIIVAELKTRTATSAAAAQAEDYALDLASFHSLSSNTTILPVVLAEQATVMYPSAVEESAVFRPGVCDRDHFAEYLFELLRRFTRRGPQLDWRAWDRAAYRPVPTIVDAARAIFAGMEVREIAHAQSDPHNLTTTVDSIVTLVQESISNNQKTICFVTGVPGSGKTLAGLRAVHDERLRQLTGSDPAFFSGNGPLVKILREALIRDAVRRGDQRSEAARRITGMVQNVHHLARTSFDDPDKRAPNERVMVFDEAQRAWNAERNHKKFKRDISEPEMLLEIMDRHDGWAVLICLVGGGQEIHDGEAGLQEWGEALRRRFRHWRVFASVQAIEGGASVAGTRLVGSRQDLPIIETPELHLSVSTRNYPRAQALNDWVNSVIAGQISAAAQVSNSNEFPVYLTRSLTAARQWLRDYTRGLDRCGLVASSGAARLRAEGLETATAFHRDYRYEYWFLNPKTDVRSSYQLEVLATEFEIQGLELDNICLCWGGDFLWQMHHWEFRNFVGTKWRSVDRDDSTAHFIRNKYRVLLTRARQAVVIWVPMGNAADPTTPPEPFERTAQILLKAGARLLDPPSLASSVALSS